MSKGSKSGFWNVCFIMVPVLFGWGLSDCQPPPVQQEIVYAPAPRPRHLVTAGAAAALDRITQDPLDETEPVLSPDGRTLIFTQSSGTGEHVTSAVIASVDAATGARRTLWTPGSSISMSPTWMPDGQALVYVSNRSGPAALVRSLSASPNSGVAIILDENQAARIGRPSVAPDGRRIAAQALIAGQPSVVSITAGTNEYSVLADGMSPCFDPTATRIAFTRVAGAQTMQTFTMRATDGTDITQVTQGEFSTYDPAYSPDGRWLVFATDRSSETHGTPARDGRRNLFAVRTDGTSTVQLTDGDAQNRNAYWAPNGWIYFASNQAGNFDLWKLRPTGELAGASTRVPPSSSAPTAVQPGT